MAERYTFYETQNTNHNNTYSNADKMNTKLETSVHAMEERVQAIY